MKKYFCRPGADEALLRIVKKPLLLAAAVAALAVGGFVLWKWTRPPHAEHDTKTATTVRPENPSGAASHATTPGSGDISIDPRVARIRFGATERFVAPNARGEFPRVPVPASAAITAAVPFPAAMPGEPISVQAEDGGVLAGPAAGGRVMIDDRHRAQIEFQTSALDGLHRVTLRRGSESRVLQFWVGPEPPVLVRQ